MMREFSFLVTVHPKRWTHPHVVSNRYYLPFGGNFVWTVILNSESLVLVVTYKCRPQRLSWSSTLRVQFYLHRVQGNPISSLHSCNYVALYCSPEHLEISQKVRALHLFFSKKWKTVVLAYLAHAAFWSWMNRLPWPHREWLSFSRMCNVVISSFHAKNNTANWRVFHTSSECLLSLLPKSDLG